jgi:peptide/nickel transport system substrate-binding protein
MLISSVSVAFAAEPPKNVNSIVIGTIGEPETIDPAWLYDTASAEIVQNVYDPLIFFAVDRSLPRDVQGLIPELIEDWKPRLATEWGVSPDGMTYTFKMRGGVRWHDGTVSTAAEMAAHAEWTFERWMIFDRSGGPTWMILEPCLGVYHSELTAAYAAAVDAAVVSYTNATGSYLEFNLVMSYPPFLTIIAQSWAGIINTDWAVAHGAWPGFGVTGYNPAVWGAWNDPIVSPFDDYPTGTGGKVMMGTGPYVFDYWTSAVEWSIYRNTNYYLGWPADLPGQGGAHPDYPGSGYAAGWVNRVTEKFIPEWATRKMLFLAGDLDFCYVPRAHIPEVITNWVPGSWSAPDPEVYPPGIDCDEPLPTLTCSPVLFYNFDIAPTSTYLGPGFNSGDPLSFGEDKIPTNFFDDINVRMGFSSAFDYDQYIREFYYGEAERAFTCVVEGLKYHNPAQTGYYHDMAAAAGNLTIAHGGQVWANGFTFTMLYNTGNVARQVAAQMTEAAVESLNPKFHIVVEEVPWPTYLKGLVSFELTGFVLGWLADYPDPHNFVFPFMHTYGDFTYFTGYSNPTVDALIEDGIATPDGPAREAIYFELQEIYVTDNPNVPLCKPTGRHWERDWVMGWYYNPIYPGGYFYHDYKGWSADTNKDYKVDLTDLYNVLIGYDVSLADAIATYGVPPCTDTEGQWERSIDNRQNDIDWYGEAWVDLDDLWAVLTQY